MAEKQMTHYIFTQRMPQFAERGWALYNENNLSALESMPSGMVRCWVTSPPYFGKLDYGVEGQAGLESTVEEYIEYQKQVAAEMLRVSTPDANLFWVIQDTFNGSGGIGGDYQNPDGSYRVKTVRGPQLKDWPRKSQLLIPERTRIAFSKVGWCPILKIVWDKSDSRRAAQDRPSYSYEEVLLFGASEENNLYEEILLFSASPMHYWNRETVLAPFAEKSKGQLKGEYTGQAKRNRDDGTENPSDTKRRIIDSMKGREGAYLRAVWNIPSGNQPAIDMGDKIVNGIASFPERLAETCINLGSDIGDIVGDPYAGLGTTLLSALKWGRNALGIELNPEYAKAIEFRLSEAGY